MSQTPFSTMRDRIEERYPPGTVIELLSTSDRGSELRSGARGEVVNVTDRGFLEMKWEQEDSLVLIPWEDHFRRISE